MIQRVIAICLLFVLISGVFSSPHTQIAYSLNIPKVWKAMQYSDTLSEREIVLTFALKNRNVEWLQRKFENVNNPFHKDYENYLTFEQIAKITSPSQTKLLIDYLTSIPDCSVLNISNHRNLITVKMSVKSVNFHFNAKMMPFIHQESKEIIFRSMNGFSLPLELVEL
ncbi:hypothetical protein ABK040_005138 [Willaertia magna]